MHAHMIAFTIVIGLGSASCTSQELKDWGVLKEEPILDNDDSRKDEESQSTKNPSPETNAESKNRAEIEPNETAAQANAMSALEATTGAVGGEMDGINDWYSFVLESDGEVAAVLSNTLPQGVSGAVACRIFNALQHKLTESHWSFAAQQKETGRFMAEAGVTYYIQVIPRQPSYRAKYLLELRYRSL